MPLFQPLPAPPRTVVGQHVDQVRVFRSDVIR